MTREPPAAGAVLRGRGARARAGRAPSGVVYLIAADDAHLQLSLPGPAGTCHRLQVLDIDGVTGGYNFQAAWTSGWCAGSAIADDAAG